MTKIIDRTQQRKWWTRCKYCLHWVPSPTSFCPKCGTNIDRQFAGMSPADIKRVLDA